MDVEALIRGFNEVAFKRSVLTLLAALDSAEFEAGYSAENAPSERKRAFLKVMNEHLTELREQLRMELGEVSP